MPGPRSVCTFSCEVPGSAGGLAAGSLQATPAGMPASRFLLHRAPRATLKFPYEQHCDHPARRQPDSRSQPGTRPIDIAQSISPRLADAAIVAKVNGELVDLTRPIEKDASVQILTAKDPESLTVYRHSTAHLLAAAVLELYPGNQARHRAAHRQRLLLRFRPRHARSRPKTSRKSKRRCGRSRRASCPTSASTPARKTA